eukprot:1193623-Prorocentrum_minimum.AAC.3
MVLEVSARGGPAVREQLIHVLLARREERPLLHVVSAEGDVRELVVGADMVMRAPVEGDGPDGEGAHVDGARQGG